MSLNPFVVLACCLGVGALPAQSIYLDKEIKLVS